MTLTLTPVHNPSLSTISVVTDANLSGLSAAEMYWIKNRPENWPVLPEPNVNEIYLLACLVDGQDTTTSEELRLDGSDLYYQTDNSPPVAITSGYGFTITLNREDSNNIDNSNNAWFIIRLYGSNITRAGFSNIYARVENNETMKNFYFVELKQYTPNLVTLGWIGAAELQYVKLYGVMNRLFATYLLLNCGNGFSYCRNLRCIIGLNAPNAKYFGGVVQVTGYTISALVETPKLKYCEAIAPVCMSRYENLPRSNSITIRIDEGSTDVDMYRTFSNKHITRIIKSYEGSINVVKLFMAFYNSKIDCYDHLFDLSHCVSLTDAFGFCYDIITIKLGDTPVCTSFVRAFYNCYKLEEVYGINLRVANDTSSIFENCYSLKRLQFAQNQLPGPNASFDISASVAWTRGGLVDLFNSLPECTTPRTITLGRNSQGALALTADDIAIATAKGWSVSI